MGKSNQYVFPWYALHVAKQQYNRVCILGAVDHDDFTRTINSSSFEFFDLALNNWDINAAEWNIELNAYDLVICMRCAYFADDASCFLQKCLSLLLPNCKALIDWGLGDHWRHKPYIVGWKNELLNVNETVTFNINGKQHISNLSSTFWDDKLSLHPAAIEFLKNIKQVNQYYDEHTLTDIIFDEVPSILTFDDQQVKLYCSSVDMLTLWSDSPQLYILTEFTKYEKTS